MTMADDYEKRIRKCFADAYNAHMRFRNARGEQFKQICAEYAELAKMDPFLSDLLNASYTEHGRDWEARKRAGEAV